MRLVGEGRREGGVREAILKLNDKLDMRYDKEDYLKNYDKNFSTEKIDQDIASYCHLLNEDMKRIIGSLKLFPELRNEMSKQELKIISYYKFSPLLGYMKLKQYCRKNKL